MWNGLFFQRSTLRELGLRVQLNHAPGRFCPTRGVGHKNFIVIHTNGIHSVNVDFCNCDDTERHVQLLRIGWWPATPKNPRSCSTMEVLRQFDILNLQGKITAFSYYRGLEYLTDSTRLQGLPVREVQRHASHIVIDIAMQDRKSDFVTMIREYRHTKMMKRAGRSYDPGGVNATAPGSLAIPCRACPLPNVNLPSGWEHVPPERAYVLILCPSLNTHNLILFSWLYTLIVAMDANFRLKSKLRAAFGKDPAMGLGWAYFVDNKPYSEFIRDYVDDDEVSYFAPVG